jgi:hypothetical protein
MASSSLSVLEKSFPALWDVAAEKGWARTRERDFQRAVDSVSGTRSGPITLNSWPAVGPVDLMLPDDPGLESKRCMSGNTLANCVWDVAKLACAIAEEKLEHGLLAAGAPDAHWANSSPGIDLFNPGL